MTDNKSMTDQNEIPDAVTEESTFNKETTRRVGDEAIDTVRKTTDIDGLEEQKDIVMHPCSCGRTEQDANKIYQCSRCTGRCCDNCHIRLSRRTLCRDCAEEAFHLTKRVYITLYLLDNGELDPNDLVTTHPVDIGLDAVTIDPATPTLLQHNYIQTDGDTIVGIETPEMTTALTVDADDPLSVEGKEALHVGEHLYGDDPDIQELKEELTLKQVTNR